MKNVANSCPFRLFDTAEDLTDWARNACVVIFSLDAQREENIRWYLEHRHTFTIERATIKVPFFAPELEAQFMEKKVAGDLCIRGVRKTQLSRCL